MGHLRNSVCQTGLIGLLVLALIYPSMCYAKDELRTWTDKSGRNKIKAKFVKLEEDVVTLEKDDGEEIEIELKKLSTADAKFATQAAKESEDNPFKSKSKPEDPFKPKSKSKAKNSKAAKEDRSDSKEDQSDDDIREIEVDLEEAQKINLSSSGRKWSIEVRKRESVTDAGKLKSVPIAASNNFHESLVAFELGQGDASKIAVIGHLLTFEKGAETTRVSLCDLSSGKASNPAVAKTKMIPIALHDDGKQILMRREEWGFGNKERLEIWTTKGSKVNKSIGWVPYQQGKTRFGKKTASDVSWAKFISPEKLATCSDDGLIVFWKFPEIEPIFQIETCTGAIPALSFDRKYLAYCTSQFVGLLDIEKQEVLVQQSTPSQLSRPNLTFSSSGNLLGCLSFGRVYVWDVATGELRVEFMCHGVYSRNHFDFIDDRFVLVDGKCLLDTENKVEVWNYEGEAKTQTVDGITYFAVSNRDKTHGAIFPIQLPQQPVIDTLNKALEDPDLFALKENTTVKIDVSGVPDGSRREQVIKGLTDRLAEIGCKAGADGTIDLVASVSGPKETTLSFIREGSFKFKEYVAEVKFVYKGREVWKTFGSNVPTGAVSLEKGEGMTAHLQALEKPGYEFFNTVSLPPLLQRPGPNQDILGRFSLGYSQVTSNGITEGGSMPVNFPRGLQRKR